MNKSIKFNHETPEASSGFLLWKLYAKWETGIKNLLKNHNLTHPQFVILATTTWFMKFAKPATQKELSNKTGIDPMTTWVIIQWLMKKWYLIRSPDINDTRAYNIHTTDIGNSILQGAMNAVDAYDRVFFSKLDPTNWKMFATYMKKLIES